MGPAIEGGGGTGIMGKGASSYRENGIQGRVIEGRVRKSVISPSSVHVSVSSLFL